MYNHAYGWAWPSQYILIIVRTNVIKTDQTVRKYTKIKYVFFKLQVVRPDTYPAD